MTLRSGGSRWGRGTAVAGDCTRSTGYGLRMVDGDRAAILSMYHRIPEGALVPRALADRVLNPECIYDKGLVLQGGIHSLRKQ